MTLLGLLATIECSKCSICSYPCDDCHVSNWRLASHLKGEAPPRDRDHAPQAGPESIHSGDFPMDMRIPPIEINIPLESNPLKSRIVVRRLAVT